VYELRKELCLNITQKERFIAQWLLLKQMEEKEFQAKHTKLLQSVSKLRDAV